MRKRKQGKMQIELKDYSLAYYNLGFIIPIGKNSAVLTRLIVRIYESGNIKEVQCGMKYERSEV